VVLAELERLAAQTGYSGPVQDELVLAIGNAHHDAWMGNDVELADRVKADLEVHLNRPSATAIQQLEMAMVLIREAQSATSLVEVQNVIAAFGELVAGPRSSEDQLDLYVSALCELRDHALEEQELAAARHARDEIRRIASRDTATERQISLARAAGIEPKA